MLKNVFLFALPWIAYTYENVALRKNTWQLNPYEDSELSKLLDASNAVDGRKTDLSFIGGQCTQSANYKDEAIWRVDLGVVLGIHHITIYYKTDNVAWRPDHGYVSRFLGFSVYISNTTDRNDGVVCFKDDYFTKYTIPSVITLNCTHHSKYVIYYNNRTSSILPPYYSQYAYNELCEFEVYGCPTADYYGENCSLPCSPHCINSRCHIETGHCFGCEDGYQGMTCEEQCDDGTFGKFCGSICGHCQDGETCGKETGACPYGCQSGYKGIYCNQTCQTVYYGPHCDIICNSSCLNLRLYSKKEDCLQKNGRKMEKEDCGNTLMFVAIGASVVLSAVIHVVAVVIAYKRKVYEHCGKKDQTPNSVSQKSKIHDTSPNYESALNDNVQGSKTSAAPSPQNSGFYMELMESQYNNTTENAYEHV